MKRPGNKYFLAAGGILLAGILAGCGGGGTPDKAPEESGTVKLTWYLCSEGPQRDEEAVERAAGRYLQEKYQMDLELDLVMYDFAGYGDKMKMVLASDAEYDICYTSSWSSNYFYYAGKGKYLPLNAYLEGEETLKGMILPEVWEGISIQGEIYGIPSNQVFFKQNYVTVVKEYADAYGLDMSKVHRMEDLDEFFHKVKDDHEEIFPLALSEAGAMGKMQLALGFENLAGEFLPGAISVGDEGLTVVNQYSLDGVKSYYELIHRWAADGIVREDAAMVSNNGLEDMKAGTAIASVNAAFKPGVEAIEKSNFGGREVVFATLSDPWMTTESISSSINAVSAKSKHPEEAFRLLTLVNMDETLYNLLCFGIEGEHYTVNEDGTVHVLEDSGYHPNADWAFGNQYLAMPREGQDPDIWEQTKEENQKAERSPALGFSFDTSRVNSQIAAVQAVLSQYRVPLDTGMTDPDREYPAFLEKLEEAGSREIIEEMERQLQDWTENRP